MEIKRNELGQIYKGVAEYNNEIHEISVIVCTYNPSEYSLFYTLDSIVNQESVNFEIIIADDGSATDFLNEVISYFDSREFRHWTIVRNQVNHGTVYNLHTGLRECNGKYVKIISPGDALYGKNILQKWLAFHENGEYKWSFSDAIYYIGDPKDKEYIEVQAHPNNILPYLRMKKSECRWNYVALGDIALGATLFCEKSIMVEYISKIIDKVIYAEDNIWRMMMFDGIVGGYFPHTAILYEYGTGISTKVSDIWENRIKRDWESANNIMLQNKQLDKFQISVVKAWRLNGNDNKFVRIFIKGKLKAFAISKIKKRKTLKRAE